MSQSLRSALVVFLALTAVFSGLIWWAWPSKEDLAARYREPAYSDPAKGPEVDLSGPSPTERLDLKLQTDDRLSPATRVILRRGIDVRKLRAPVAVPATDGPKTSEEAVIDPRPAEPAPRPADAELVQPRE